MAAFRARQHKQRRIAVGVAWYRPEQWQRLREISVDKDGLEETYQEWVEGAEKAIRELRRQGVQPEKVDVNVEELLRWCQTQNIPVNGESRSDYVAVKMQSKRHEEETKRKGAG